MPRFSLTKLFRLIELTRSQVQQGYVLAEIPKAELSDLAQHHYVVTFIAWQLGRLVIQAGGKLNMARLLELSLIHDLGELFGSDISMPYGRANPVAKKASRAFEEENQRYLAQLFPDDSNYIADLFADVMNPKTDEAQLFKVADYIEVTHYKLYTHSLSKGDITMAVKKIQPKLDKMHDPITKKVLTTFMKRWKKDMAKGKLPELFEEAKNK